MINFRIGKDFIYLLVTLSIKNFSLEIDHLNILDLYKQNPIVDIMITKVPAQ